MADKKSDERSGFDIFETALLPVGGMIIGGLAGRKIAKKIMGKGFAARASKAKKFSDEATKVENARQSQDMLGPKASQFPNRALPRVRIISTTPEIEAKIKSLKERGQPYHDYQAGKFAGTGLGAVAGGGVGGYAASGRRKKK